MQFQVKQFQQLYFITEEVIFPLEMCFLTDSIYKLLIPHLYFLHQTVFIKGKIRNTGLPVKALSLGIALCRRSETVVGDLPAVASRRHPDSCPLSQEHAGDSVRFHRAG